MALGSRRTTDVTDRKERILGAITDGASAIAPSEFGAGMHPRDVIDRGARVLGQLTNGTDTINPLNFGSGKLTNIYDVRPSELYGADETVVQSVTLDCLAEGKRNVEIYAKATAATDFTLEASADNTHWFPINTYSAVTAAHDGFINATRYIKLSSATAGVAGDTVNLLITSM